MPLTIQQIREILKAPKSRNKITTAVAHEDRLRLHCQTALEQRQASRAVTDFLEWVRSLIPADKYKVFCSLFRFPVTTVELCEQIFQALEKIFDGQNPVYRVEFLSRELAQDWEAYRRENLGEPGIWRSEGFEAMKTAINSVLVVDLPQEQTSTRPEPYYFWLDISKVVDFSETDGIIEWIMFRQPGEQLAVFDDGFFRLFALKKNTLEIENIVSEAAHDLGYCPARFFWTTPMTRREKWLKQSPLSNQLSALDKWLFLDISKDHLDLYARFPVYWGFEQECDFEHPETREYCDGGFLRDAEQRYIITRDGMIRECPACSKKRLTGAGSFVEVPVPGPENDNANLRDPVGIVSIDRNSLDYNTEDNDRRWGKIYQAVTGYGGEPINNQAVNEKQVIATFEARTTVLRNLKEDFEQAQKWTTETVCRLRYGTGFVSASVNYGTDFYLFTADNLLEMYRTARANQLDDTILDMLQDQYYETKYRNNPEQLERMNILKNLDPFRHLTRNEVRGMYEAGQISFEEYFLKVNFSSLILRFERENISILEFADALDFRVKIERIKQILLSYVTTQNNEGEGDNQPAGQPAGAGSTS